MRRQSFCDTTVSAGDYGQVICELHRVNQGTVYIHRSERTDIRLGFRLRLHARKITRNQLSRQCRENYTGAALQPMGIEKQNGLARAHSPSLLIENKGRTGEAFLIPDTRETASPLALRASDTDSWVGYTDSTSPTPRRRSQSNGSRQSTRKEPEEGFLHCSPVIDLRVTTTE